MTTTYPEQSERLRGILAERVVVDELAGEHTHGRPGTDHLVFDGCPACRYRERITAELDGAQPLTVGLVGECAHHLGMTVGELLLEAGRPAWATALDSDDIGGPDEFVRWTAELVRIPGSFEPTDLVRDGELTITAVQFSTAQGDVPPGVPVLEVNTVKPGDRLTRGTLSLSLDDARGLALSLLRAVWQIEPPANPAVAEQIADALERTGR